MERNIIINLYNFIHKEMGGIILKFKSKIGMALVLTGVMVATTGCGSLIDITNNNQSSSSSSTTAGSDSTQNTSNDAESSEKINQVLTEAQSAIDDQNYEDAITTLETALKKSPTNKDLIAKYVNAVKLRANELTSKNDYDTALAVLQSAKKQLKNNDEIDKLYEETKKNSPDKLCDLTIAEQNDRYIPVTEQKVMTDTVGNAYDPGNLFMLKTYGEDGGYAKYYLGGKYKSLQFTYAVSTEDSYYIDPTTLTIFGDGDKILFTSGEMTRTTEPTATGIDVTGQKWLYIRVSSDSYNSVPVLMANPVLFE